MKVSLQRHDDPVLGAEAEQAIEHGELPRESDRGR